MLSGGPRCLEGVTVSWSSSFLRVFPEVVQAMKEVECPYPSTVGYGVLPPDA